MMKDCTSSSMEIHKYSMWTRSSSAPARNLGVIYTRDFKTANINVQLIGGADVAAELDAKRAIAQGTRLALTL